MPFVQDQATAPLVVVGTMIMVDALIGAPEKATVMVPAALTFTLSTALPRKLFELGRPAVALVIGRVPMAEKYSATLL